MARVMLSSEEVGPGVLPPCCLVCGAKAEGAARASMRSVPVWCYFLLFLGFLPFAIAYVLSRQEITVSAPVCSRHRSHFLWRQWLLPAGILAALLTLVSPVVIQPDARPFPPTWALIGTVALLAGTIIAVIWLRQTGVRVASMSRDAVELDGVSPDFVSALELGRADYKRRMHEWLERHDRAPS